MQEVIRVFLIEDNRLLRGGLVTLLNGHPDIAVIAAVEHAEGALPLIRNTRPHVVLMDPSLEDDSYDLVVRLREAAPEVKVIVMDLLPEEKDVIDFTEAGASGFIAKDATEDELLLTIRSVAAGEGSFRRK